MKRISILGSTGSVGRQAMEVIRHLGFSAAAITGNRNVTLMEEQARQFNPAMAVMFDEEAASELKARLRDTDVAVYGGGEGMIAAAEAPSDMVLTAVVGMAGLAPTLAAIKAGRQIAFANKETLVCAGELMMERAGEGKMTILPVDSEHSAIFQCLEGRNGAPRRVILTASGGPFFGMSAEALRTVTREQALRHPTWRMGKKITIDSATMMNKGLELIEAMWLYDLPEEKIEIVIHRESIVHSMVEFEDGAIIAQLSSPDMRMPIQYALTWPERVSSLVSPMDFKKGLALSFAPPDEETFYTLRLAREAAKKKGNAGAVLNGANEEAVALFLAGHISFGRIAEIVAEAMEAVPYIPRPSLAEILESDEEAKRAAREAAGIK